MLIFSDTLINMKTENRWKKIRAQAKGAKKNSCIAQRRKKKCRQDKICPPPSPLKNKMVHPERTCRLL